jgi:hypothetical protein
MGSFYGDDRIAGTTCVWPKSAPLHSRGSPVSNTSLVDRDRFEGHRRRREQLIHPTARHRVASPIDHRTHLAVVLWSIDHLVVSTTVEQDRGRTSPVALPRSTQRATDEKAPGTASSVALTMGWSVDRRWLQGSVPHAGMERSTTLKRVRHLRWLKARLGYRLIDSVVVTPGPTAYRRQDGIAVVPAALLGP